jgi:hypothetical protein
MPQRNALMLKFAQICEFETENNSFLNVRNRFCFNRGKSLKQREEICEIAFWQKIRKRGQAHFKSPGPCAFLLVILLGLASQIKIFGEAPPKSKASYEHGYL